MNIKTNQVLGILCVLAGMVVIVVALGDWLLRLIIALMGLSLINYGLRLRGLPSLQVLIPLMMSRRRWF